jgi:hypothetical protein
LAFAWKGIINHIKPVDKLSGFDILTLASKERGDWFSRVVLKRFCDHPQTPVAQKRGFFFFSAIETDL